MKYDKNSKFKSKYIGVHYRTDVNRFRVSIRIDKKIKYLGYFDLEIDAAKSYDEAAVKYGLIKKLNFPMFPENNIPNTRLIKLSQGYFAVVDEEDFERLNQYSWSLDKTKTVWYAATTIPINNKMTKVRMHNFILGIQNSNRKIVIDHKNHNGLHNYKSNLRTCTQSQNCCNQRIRLKLSSSSRFKGVTWNSRINRYASNIKVDGKSHSLGSFLNEIDAAVAYDKAALRLSGEFALINFPEL